MPKTIYLINFNSNEGQAQDDWNKIQSLKKIPQSNVFELLKIDNLEEFIDKKSPETIVVGGGDGSINAVCKAIYKKKKKPQVAILPLGFGNALSYCLGVETIEKALDTIEQKHDTLTIDLIKTNLEKYPIGVFSVSAGFDARIVHDRMNQRYIGLRSYVLSSIKTLFTHSDTDMEITIDQVTTIRSTATSLVVANSPVIGHNFEVSSEARLNDGLLDCTLFSTKYDYLKNLRFRGFKHPLYSQGGKVHLKAKEIKVIGEQFVQVDGEPQTSSDKSLVLKILPNQITFLKNQDSQINQPQLAYNK